MYSSTKILKKRDTLKNEVFSRYYLKRYLGEGGPPGDNFYKIAVIMLKKDGTYANSC